MFSMKGVSLMIGVLSTCFIAAQQLPNSFEEIPVAENLVYIKSFDSFSVYRFCREEIYQKYTDKSKIGESYKQWALQSRQIMQYDFVESSETSSKLIFDFYQKLLKARISEPSQYTGQG
ncbi:MAG TPA: hypothetical protein PLM49_04885, partial [Bacteroidales bacterium]|nr:hypothetical protein [Bacteroidales bacterium]